jgi:hypothetical protein
VEEDRKIKQVIVAYDSSHLLDYVLTVVTGQLLAKLYRKSNKTILVGKHPAENRTEKCKSAVWQQ